MPGIKMVALKWFLGCIKTCVQEGTRSRPIATIG
jgi:hypothetical protein